MITETQLQYKEISQMEAELTRKLLHEGKITDFERGYLSLPWVNELIDPKLQRFAARLLANKVVMQLTADHHVLTKVVGVPSMGSYLAVPLAEELDTPLVVARKGRHIPTRWTQAIKIEESMKKYTNGAAASHIYNGLIPGDTALFVDDILGDGDTLTPIITWALQYGIIPYVGVYVTKLYRPGYKKMLDLGIQPAFVYGIEGVQPDGKFILNKKAFS